MESFLFVEVGEITGLKNNNINKPVMLLVIMDCCDYIGVRIKLESGEIRPTSCYDAKTNEVSNDARKLPGLFPDFDESFKNSIRRLEKLS